MTLTDADVEIGKIFLDPHNPRFLTQENISQSSLVHKIFQGRDAKELLASMAINVKWVNKIVVLPKSNFTVAQMKIPEISSADYLVIEGNNRLACLKSGKIPGYDDASVIPVIVATKEQAESDEDFQAQIRVLQGIANVMVVKEWSILSKARHLYRMYYDFLERSTPAVKPLDVHKRIAQELGMSVTEVRESIIRYEFYKNISELSDTIPESRWGYLEAFDRTKEIREKFGMSSISNSFELESDQEGIVEEILKEIPALISKAFDEGINSKQFRDIIGSVFHDISDRTSVYEKITDIVRPDSEFSFRANLTEQNAVSEESKWSKRLTEIVDYLNSYPTMQPWASSQKEQLEKIRDVAQKHIGAI